MPERAVREAPARRWIGLEEASQLLGISATTLRRWSDAGLLETFVTPGGHRRFSAAAVEAFLPGSPKRPTMERLGETPERISRVYRKASQRTGMAWIGLLPDDVRQTFREHGRVVATELLATLDAATEADRAVHLAAASDAAAAYGTAAAVRDIPVSAAVETFLRFRRPFVDELVSTARRRGLDTAAATDLIGRATDVFDQLLVATMRAYDEGGRRGRSRRQPSPASSVGRSAPIERIVEPAHDPIQPREPETSVR